MLGESAYQLAQLSDIKNITAASSSILRIFLDSAYEQKTTHQAQSGHGWPLYSL